MLSDYADERHTQHKLSKRIGVEAFEKIMLGEMERLRSGMRAKVEEFLSRPLTGEATDIFSSFRKECHELSSTAFELLTMHNDIRRARDYDLPISRPAPRPMKQTVSVDDLI